LDWHYRVNNRLKEDKRGQSRSWYLDEEAWIRFVDDNADTSLAEAAMVAANGSLNSSKTGTSEDALKRYVPVPTDTVVASTPCPICKEKFKSVWHDQMEEWVWMNAVESENGKIYHATCFEDTDV
ncbi:hypothetical protein V1512DRAFT_213704, partial [Lipomyces arxii]|uniref:uncharacterized protein n=1 Tax=Lipomyces arxii TaxID=56418 RepID=UPI0034CF2D80